MKTRRILSSILSFVMIFTLVVYSPRVTFAENNTAPASESIQDEGKESGLQAEDSLEGMVDQDGQSEEDDEADGETDKDGNTNKDGETNKDDDTNKDADKDTEDSSAADDTSAAGEEDASKDNGSAGDESSAADETDTEETDESGTGGETGAADESGNAGSESSAADESGNAGEESSAADESGNAGEESSAADESGNAGNESSAADESGNAGSESSAADESESTDAQEESTAADETTAPDDSAANETESTGAETDAAENETTPAGGTETGAGTGTGNANGAGSTTGAGGNSGAGGGTKLPLASDSNASVGGGGGAGENGKPQKLTAEQVAEMSFAELYEYIMGLETDEGRESVLKLLPEEDYIEFLDYIAMIEFVDPVNFTQAGPLLLMPKIKMAAMMRSALQNNLEEPEGLKLSKIFDQNEDGSGTLRLEAYTTGKVTGSGANPLDIVLVLDQSGSMADLFGGLWSPSKQESLKTSVKKFIEGVAEEAREKNVDHQIAIVTYGSNASIKSNLKSAATQEVELKEIINKLPQEPYGSTNTGAGMEMAANVLKTSRRDSVVILFTDGVPTTSSSFSDSVANKAIAAAKEMKDKETTVYTVGIFSGADPEVLYGTQNATGEPGEVGYQWEANNGIWNTDEEILANRFMNFVSSNYPDARNMGLERITGSFGLITKKYKITESYERKNQDGDYYLTASDQEGLEEIFQSIVEQIGQANIELGGNAYLQDVISPYFKLDENINISDIKVYTEDCVGVDSQGNYRFDGHPQEFDDAEVEILGNDSKTIQVKNFDYDKYYVRDQELDGTYGKRLIVEIPIVPDYDTTGTFGGNGFPTNLEDGESGIFNEEGLVGGFKSPHGDLPVQYEFAVRNKSVYLSSDFSGNLMEIVEAVDGYEPGKDAGEEKNNSRVSITYTFKCGNETATYTINPEEGLSDGVIEGSISALTGIQDDVLLEISCTISAISGNDNVEDLDKANATIYVYHPTIPFKDSCIYLGELANYQDNAGGSIIWSYPGTKNVPEIDSTIAEPSIQIIRYSPGAEEFEQETYVTVSEIQVGDLKFDMTKEKDKAYIGFSHDNCEYLGDDCRFDSIKGQFIVHVKTCSLTIEKQVKNPEDTQQMFIFQVSGPDSRSWTVAIQGAGKKTITGLPIGNYTVSEDVDWSWRYECDTPTKTCKLAKDAPNGTVTIENVLHNDKWLSDEVEGNNVFDPVPVSGSKTLAFLRKEETYEF